MADEPTLRKEEKDERMENTKMTITVEVERIFDPNRKRNNLMMVMEAASIAGEGEDDPIAEVMHGIPCHTIIRDKETKEDWVLNYLSLFKAYDEARKNLKTFESMEEARSEISPCSSVD